MKNPDRHKNPRKPVHLTPEHHQKLSHLAEKNKRTLQQQIAILIDKCYTL